MDRSVVRILWGVVLVAACSIIAVPSFAHDGDDVDPFGWFHPRMLI